MISIFLRFGRSTQVISTPEKASSVKGRYSKWKKNIFKCVQNGPICQEMQ